MTFQKCQRFSQTLVIVGIWILLTPGKCYINLSLLCALTFPIVGIIEKKMPFLTAKENFWSPASGIINLIIGILLVSRPAISALVSPFYVGFANCYQSDFRFWDEVIC